MKKLSIGIKIFLILSLIVFTLSYKAYPQDVEKDQIAKWIEQLKYPDCYVRNSAIINLDRLPEEQKTERVRISLINLLEEELAGKYEVLPGEGGGEYFSTLLDAVCKLRDARAIPSLLTQVQTGWVVIRAVAADRRTCCGTSFEATIRVNRI